MIVQNLITNPTVYNMTQSTVTQITTETCLKALGRPGFILMDNNIDQDTKKFSSVKEFLYQMTCLGIYLAAIMPIINAGSFKLARKLFKDEDVFKAFKKANDFTAYHKAKDVKKQEILAEINKNNKNNKIYKDEDFNKDLAKGVIELSSIAGSVVGLAILAPLVSHPLIHPILKGLHLDKKAIEENQQATTNSIDTNA